MKTVTIPFDLELAKKIQSGEVEGKIVDKKGNKYQIVKWDNPGEYSLICTHFNEEFNIITACMYTFEGKYAAKNKESDFDLQLEVPEYLTWKEGDYLTIVSEMTSFIVLYKSYMKTEYIPIKHHAIYNLDGKHEVCFNDVCSDYETVRPSTPFEIAKLIDALLKEGKAWNPETRQIEDIETVHTVEKLILKPFDRVLVRDDPSNKWGADLYSYMDGDTFCCISNYWNYCIPYEGNEHLLGTTNEPEE